MTAPAPAPLDDHRAERVALFFGILVVALAVAAGAVLWQTDPDALRRLAIQASTHAVVGRETGIPTGLAMDLPVVFVATLAAAQDAAILLIGYPLVVFAGRGALRIPLLDRIVHKPHPQRDRFARRTEAGGVGLLALSLWIPFLPSGALVAALLGRAAGYRPRIFLPALAGSAFLADVAYVILAHRVGEAIGFGRLVFVALGIVVTVAIVVFVRSRLKRASAP